VAVHDGGDIRPRPVDLAVYEALEEAAAAIGVHGVAVEVVLDDIAGRHARRGDAARHQVTARRCRMAHGNVAEAVHHTLRHEYAARRGEVLEEVSGDRTGGSRRTHITTGSQGPDFHLAPFDDATGLLAAIAELERDGPAGKLAVVAGGGLH